MNDTCSCHSPLQVVYEDIVEMDTGGEVKTMLKKDQILDKVHDEILEQIVRCEIDIQYLEMKLKKTLVSRESEKLREDLIKTKDTKRNHESQISIIEGLMSKK